MKRFWIVEGNRLQYVHLKDCSGEDIQELQNNIDLKLYT